MSDVTDLIEEARAVGRPYRQHPYAGLVGRLADALEAAERRAKFHAEQEAGLRDDIGNLEAERDALAAVIEQTEDFVTRHYLDTRFGDEVLPLLAARTVLAAADEAQQAETPTPTAEPVEALYNLEPDDLADLLTGLAEGAEGLSHHADLRRAADVIRLLWTENGLPETPAEPVAYALYDRNDGELVSVQRWPTGTERIAFDVRPLYTREEDR